MSKFFLPCLLITISLFLPFSQSGWIDPPPRYACPDRPIYPCNCTKGSDEGVYVECSNTNIASLALGLQSIKTLIHTLVIRNCNMEKIFGSVFKPLTIIILKIIDTPIKDISDGTFDEPLTSSLKELHIIGSHLTRLPPSIKSLTSLTLLNVEQSRITFLPDGVFDDMKSLVDLSISDSEITQVSTKLFNELVSLKRLSLFKNQLTNLERNTFRAQSELEYLDLSHNKFAKLQPHFFPNLRKLLWLNVSHNEIPELHSRAFSRNSLLRVLHVNHNKIDQLTSNSLRGMRFLRRLYISDNKIPSVGRGAFRAISRIGTIDLARNELKSVDFQMFSDLRFIDTINLQENQIQTIQKEAFSLLYLTKINISYNEISFLGPGLFIDCENMTSLDLSHNQITDISPEAFNENTYALELRLEYNNLTSMSQVPLKSQRGLKYLNVSHNSIMDIPKKTFPKLFELNTIDMSHNALMDIDNSVFAQLLALRHLDLSHNNLTEIGTSTFGKLPTLLDLDLSHNALQKVRRSAFMGLSSIRSIRLDHNELNEVPLPPISLNHLFCSYNKVNSIKGRQPWPVMNSLLTLDLEHNLLGESLVAGRFEGLTVVKFLNLKYNNITRPPKEALEALRSLNYIYLDGNQITNLTKDAFGKLPVLFELGLSNNLINNVTEGAFSGLLQLLKLDLSGNNLTYIPPGAFKGMVSLREVDLSQNRLQYLQNKTHGLFEDTISIRKINLRHNEIPFITAKMLPESRWYPYKLQYLDLSHNLMPVLTKEILTGTKFLEHLNVSHNMLNDVRKGVFQNLTALKVLDISGNVLTDKVLTESTFGFKPNLTVFKLHHNRFQHLPIQKLSRHINLKVLDLRYNQIKQYYPQLTPLIKTGLDVYYEGNPLECDCSLRPLAYWLISVGDRKGRSDPWTRAICDSPSYLNGIPMASLLEERLTCSDSKNAAKFKLNPDVKFREVKEIGDKIQLSWYVSTNEDIGDFRIELRTLNIPPLTLYERDVEYGTRYTVLENNVIAKDKEFTVCLLAKNSAGRIRRWRQDQCERVSSSSRNLITKDFIFVNFVILVICFYQ